MLIRKTRLANTHSAGLGDETTLRTVHSRPPKKIAPSASPAAPAGISGCRSFAVIGLVLPNRLVFVGYPVPSVQAAERQPGHQQRERPGVSAGMVLVQPRPESRAEQ